MRIHWPAAALIGLLAAGPPVLASAPAAAAPGVPAAVPAAAYLATPTVRYGDHGAVVLRLQKRLAALHYDVGSLDGKFGYDTLHAVYAFQKVQRIGVDGTVGRVTWQHLSDPYVPRARHRLSAAAVEVDLTHRVVYLTRNGAVTRIVDASPGKPSTRTPTGTFSITRRINGWRHSPLGLLWRPNYFYRGDALHGSKSVPTYAASHGCVRVTVPAMNRLWSVLHVGERVYVYR